MIENTFQSYMITRYPERFVGKTVTMSGKGGGMWEKVTITAYRNGELHLEGGSWIRNTFAEEPVREPLDRLTSCVYPYDVARGVIYEDEG